MKGMIVLLGVYVSFSAFADYRETDFKTDLYSAYKDKTSQKIWLYGSSLTAGLILFRDQLVEPLQEDWGENEPLGELSPIGDYAGQLIPNAMYMAYQYWFSESSEGNRRATYMLKASAFAGLTTFFLKRLINEKRPNGGDRNSMPSGHTTTAFAFASVVSIEHPQWTWPAYALATFVGLSRINDNAHYLHNVTMGATIGMAYGYGLRNSSFKNVNYMIFPLNDGATLSYSNRF